MPDEYRCECVAMESHRSSNFPPTESDAYCDGDDDDVAEQAKENIEEGKKNEEKAQD